MVLAVRHFETGPSGGCFGEDMVLVTPDGPGAAHDARRTGRSPPGADREPSVPAPQFVFNHVGHVVTDLARSRRFYEELLGFTFWWEFEVARRPRQPGAARAGADGDDVRLPRARRVRARADGVRRARGAGRSPRARHERARAHPHLDRRRRLRGRARAGRRIRRRGPGRHEERHGRVRPRPRRSAHRARHHGLARHAATTASPAAPQQEAS